MPHDFIAEYLIYATKNEAPRMFHVWAGYTALSTVIGRRVWFLDEEHPIFANIYVLLIAHAGGGKSYALEKMEGLLTDVGDIAMTYDVETTEGMIRYMAGEPNKKPAPIVSATQRKRIGLSGKEETCHELLLIANEFIDFIRVNPSGWTGFLNNIYYKPSGYKYRTKNSPAGTNEDKIPGPYLTLFGAIPTDISTKLQDIDIITTGFARRCIMQYGARQFDTPFARPVFGEEERAAKAFALQRLKDIRNLVGQIRETSEAALWWDTWYNEHTPSIPQRSTPATHGWLSSKSMQVRKIAMLTSLARRDDLLIIPEDYEIALGWLTEMEKGFPMIFGGVGRNELAQIAIQVLSFVRTQSFPVGRKRLQAEFFPQMTGGKGFADLWECLDHLVNTGDLSSFNVTDTTLQITEQCWATPEVQAAFVAKYGAKAVRPQAGATGMLSTRGVVTVENP